MTSNREILAWLFENIGNTKVTEQDAPSPGSYHFLQTLRTSNKLIEQFYWKWMDGASREEDTAATAKDREIEHTRSLEEIDRLLESFAERTQAA